MEYDNRLKKILSQIKMKSSILAEYKDEEIIYLAVYNLSLDLQIARKVKEKRTC